MSGCLVYVLKIKIYFRNTIQVQLKHNFPRSNLLWAQLHNKTQPSSTVITFHCVYVGCFDTYSSGPLAVNVDRTQHKKQQQSTGSHFPFWVTGLLRASLKKTVFTDDGVDSRNPARRNVA